jgi:hypothetical protein
MRASIRPAPILVTLSMAAHAIAADDYRVTVEAGEHDRLSTPIILELPADLSGDEDLELLADDSRNPLPMQRLPGAPARAMFVLEERLIAGESRSYRLRPLTPAPHATSEPVADCRRTEVGLRINLRGSPMLQYNTEVIEPPAGIDGVYRRSGHIHPVSTPAGRVVTEEFPEDHPHQHGIFNAWVNTHFEGRAVDFWNQAGETGRVEHVAVESINDGNVFAQFRARLRHSDLTHPDGPHAVLDEQMLVRAFNVPQGFLFDIESRQVCVAEAPLIINEYHYGGMAWRGADGWLGQPEHDFLTSEGKTRTDGNHTRPVWVAAHGLVDGEPCAIVIFGHPENFRHPQPVRLHPSKPYFVFTPPVLGEFSIEPGAEYVARYRYLVHDGPVNPVRYDRIWQDMADPPAVRVLAAGAANR